MHPAARRCLVPSLLCAAAVALAQSPDAPRPAATTTPAAPQQPAVQAPARNQGVREFLGLGPLPDPDAVRRGAPLYAANCGFCHGPQARGAEGPNLIYSEVVLKDAHGASLAVFLQNGRPDRGMPSFASLSEEQRRDVAEFLHQQVEDVANRGTYEVKNIVLGDARKGGTFVSKHCLSCHAVSGDLKGLGAKWRPVDLQKNWIMPPRGPTTAVTAQVDTPKSSLAGRVTQLDDFRVVLDTGANGIVVVPRTPDVKMTLKDPLSAHVALIGKLADADMINVTAYLESLK